MISEHRAFVGYAVYIRRPVTHRAMTISTHVLPADVIGEKDEDIGFLLRDGSMNKKKGKEPSGYYA